MMMSTFSRLSPVILFLVAAFSISLPFSEASYYPDLIYLDEHCFGTYTVGGDLRIKLSYSSYLKSDYTCHITLRPSTGSRLVARFRRYDMTYSYIDSRNDCQYEAIQLSSPTRTYFGNRGYCAASTPSGQYDLGSSGTYSYQTWKYSYIVPGQIELLVTEVTDKNGAGDCPDGFFDCERINYCIDEDLTCNGYNDCGNDRDEVEGCGLTPGIIGGIAAGVIFFIVLIVIASFFSVRRYRRRAVYIQYN